MTKSGRYQIGLRFIVSLLLFCAGVMTTSGALNPDQIIPITTEKEKRMGANIARHVEEQFDEVDDPLIQMRVTRIGERLARVSDRQDLIYHFTVLQPKEGEVERYYNAFTLPGGYI